MYISRALSTVLISIALYLNYKMQNNHSYKDEKKTIFWFRRDLRIEDNHALFKALKKGNSVMLIFIFDNEILDSLPVNDPRVSFIYKNLKSLNEKLNAYNSSILCLKGKPLEIFKNLEKEYSFDAVYFNKDYEPYAIHRDSAVKEFLEEKNIKVFSYKDQVIFEEKEIVKNDGQAYTVFTPYKNKWKLKVEDISGFKITDQLLKKLCPIKHKFPALEDIGFSVSEIKVKPYTLEYLKNYEEERNFPDLDHTSYLSVHLRFGTVSIRHIFNLVKENDSFLNELIWREFFMQILWQFPNVQTQNFKPKYNTVKWRNDENDFQKWKEGKTGYPIVDAGMRELNQTGYMHNRVRMIVSGFLCKHLLIDWRWGESYFAEKLLDYELSSNNGNWQWAAGTGCDAAPYFRIFNPYEQIKKFDKELKYINKWVPELNTFDYPMPMIEHKYARERALKTYKIGLQ